MAPLNADGSKIHLSVEITQHFLIATLLIDASVADKFEPMSELAMVGVLYPA